MNKTVCLNEKELNTIIAESVKIILNESKDKFIKIELPEELSDDDDVMYVIRDAMSQIGYQYYNNEYVGEDDRIIYRYAPIQKPVEYYL